METWIPGWRAEFSSLRHHPSSASSSEMPPTIWTSAAPTPTIPRPSSRPGRRRRRSLSAGFGSTGIHRVQPPPPNRYLHRHRIDKYLDTLLANQPILDGEATDHCKKVTSQDGWTARVNSSPIRLTNHWLRRSRTWSEITNDVIDVSSAVT